MEAAVLNNFRLYAPEDCHYRKGIDTAGPKEMEAVVLAADHDMGKRSAIPKDEDVREWKEKEKRFRAWFHNVLAGYGFKRKRNKSYAAVLSGLTMIAWEQIGTFSDEFYFNFEMDIPPEIKGEAGANKIFGRWHDGSCFTLDWLLTTRDVFDASLRSYLDRAIVPALS